MTYSPCRVTIDGQIYRFISGTIAFEAEEIEIPQPRDVLRSFIAGKKKYHVDITLSRSRKPCRVVGDFQRVRVWDFGRRVELVGG